MKNLFKSAFLGIIFLMSVVFLSSCCPRAQAQGVDYTFSIKDGKLMAYYNHTSHVFDSYAKGVVGFDYGELHGKTYVIYWSNTESWISEVTPEAKSLKGFSQKFTSPCDGIKMVKFAGDRQSVYIYCTNGNKYKRTYYSHMKGYRDSNAH